MAVIDKHLLDILVCPVTGAALDLLDTDALDECNRRIAGGKLHFADGTPVEQPLQAGLRSADRSRVYPIEDGIPVMLPERGIICDG